MYKGNCFGIICQGYIKANELVFRFNGPEWEGFGVFGKIEFGMSWDNICLINFFKCIFYNLQGFVYVEI